MEGKRGERSRGARAMSWIEYHLTGPAGSLPTLQHRKTPQYGGQLLLPVWPWHGSIRDATLLLASPFPLPLPPSSPSHFLTLPQKINKKHSHHLCRVTTTSIAYHAQHRLYTAHTDTHRHLGQTHTSNMTNPHWWALCAFILTIKCVSGWVSVCLSCVCIFFFEVWYFYTCILKRKIINVIILRHTKTVSHAHGYPCYTQSHRLAHNTIVLQMQWNFTPCQLHLFSQSWAWRSGWQGGNGGRGHGG